MILCYHPHGQLTQSYEEREVRCLGATYFLRHRKRPHCLILGAKMSKYCNTLRETRVDYSKNRFYRNTSRNLRAVTDHRMRVRGMTSDGRGSTELKKHLKWIFEICFGDFDLFPFALIVRNSHTKIRFSEFFEI